MTRREALDERAAEIVLRALDEDRLGRGGAAEADAGVDAECGEELRAEVRGYTDLLGLLPAALEERPLPPEVKCRLMAAIREAAAEAAEDEEPAVVVGKP